MYALPELLVWHTDFLGPLRNTLCLSVILDQTCRAPVHSLLTVCRPLAVIRRIVSVRVDPVD